MASLVSVDTLTRLNTPDKFPPWKSNS